LVEADRLPPSILVIYKVIEHIYIIDMLSIGIQQQPSYTVTIPILVGSDFGFLGHLWSQNDVNTSWSDIFTPPANALDLSIEENDLFFCTCICRWPLPSPSYLCDPANALGLSIKEKDLLFCTRIGRWPLPLPLPLPSYLCNPANLLGLSIEEKTSSLCLCPPTYAILPICLASQWKRRTSSSAHA
jgi:hypothetical protein